MGREAGLNDDVRLGKADVDHRIVDLFWSVLHSKLDHLKRYQLLQYLMFCSTDTANMLLNEFWLPGNTSWVAIHT